MNVISASKLAFVVSLLGLAVSAVPAYAQVAPGIQLKDGLGDIVTISSTGAVTTSGLCTPLTCITTASVGIQNTNGQVGWAGTIGTFTLTAIGTAATNDVNISGLTTLLGGTLTVLFTTNNLDGAGPYILNQSSNFQAGGGTVTYTSYVDTTNTAFGTGLNLDLAGIIVSATSSASSTFTGPASHALALTEQVVLVAGLGTQFSSDYFTAYSTNPPLSVSCASGSATAGVAYSSMLSGSGGVPSYVYSIVGSLPAGLSLNPSTGAVTGTPSTQGTLSYTAKVTDSSGSTSANTATSSCSVTISPPATPLSLSCSGTTGQVGTAFSSNLVAAGGTGKGYMYSILTGSLPTSLTLNSSTGFITGTPSAAGGFTFTAQVTDTGDSAEAPSTKSCTVTIAPAPIPLSLTCAATAGTVGSAYSSALSATGGTPAYTFSIVSGSLPTGLTLNASTGAITGTPGGAGTFPYTFQVKDSTGATAQKSCSIGIINAQVAPLSVTCPTATATVGVAYSSTVPVTGGVSPYTYAVSAGSLPAGLTLNATTGAITGTPTTAGTSGFTITVTDHAGTVAKSSCTGTCTAGSATSVNFNSPTGSLGNSHVYVVSGVSVTAYGYNNSGAATALDGQNNSGVQNDGLGIYSGSSGQIDTGHFVQLDLSAAIAAGATNGQLLIGGINQCQNGESYDVYGSNTLGSIGTLLVSAGTNDSSYFSIPSFGTYKYISVRAHSGNVLIGNVSFTLPGPTCNIAVAAPPTPKISLKKSANVTTVSPFQPVTYTYTITNTGNYTLTNVVVKDDNATPSYTADDFTVGTVASLVPGASATLTATVIPPVSECATPQSYSGWGGNNWGSGGWGGSSSSPAGTLICSKESSGNYKITWRQDPGQTDNTYGRGSSTIWSGQQRNFSDMVGGQAAEFKFIDGYGNCVLDVATDYISKSTKFPSGYGTLGVTGGNGAVISGSGTHVVSCDTTLSHNINSSSSFYGCTQDSPSSSNWDYVSGYTIEVDSKTFGSGGWGGVAIPECHNQNSAQQGCNDTKVSPTSSSATNTATATATGNGVTVTATATATVKIDASSSNWSQCNKY